MGRFDKITPDTGGEESLLTPAATGETSEPGRAFADRFAPPPAPVENKRQEDVSRALKLAQPLNPDTEAQAVKLSKDKNVSLPYARTAVEQGVSKGVPSHNTLNYPAVQKYIGNSPSNTSVSKEDLINDGLLNVGRATGHDTRRIFHIDGSDAIDENDPLDQERLRVASEPTFSLKEKTKRALEVGKSNLALGDLGYKQLLNDTPETEAEIFEFLANSHELIPGDDIIEDVVIVSATMAPLIGRSFVKGVETGGKIATAFGIWMAALGQIGPQAMAPEEIFTVPAGIAVGYGTGFSIGAAETIFKQEAGHFFIESQNIRDVNGQPIDRNALRAASVGYASISTLLELMGLKYITKTIPGAEKLLGRLTKPVVKKVLQNPSVIQRLIPIGVKLAQAVGANAFEEASQEAAAIISEELVKHYSQAKEGTYFLPIDWGRAFSTRVIPAGEQGGLGGFGWGLPGTMAATVKVGADVNRSMKFQEKTDLVQEEINETFTKKRSEAHAEQYLKATELQSEAFISPEGIEAFFKTDEELAKKTLTKIGVDPVKAREKAILGQDTKIDLALLHSKKLTQEEIASVQTYLKPDPDSYTKKQLEDKAAVEEMELLTERWEEQTVEEEGFQNEITRVKEEIVKTGSDKAFAEDAVNILERTANSFALQGTDRTAFLSSLSIERKVFETEKAKLSRILKKLKIKTAPEGVLIVDTDTPGLHHSKYLINIFEKGNEATVVHELMGHVFLEEMDVIAKTEGVSEQFKKDTASIHKWAGAKEGRALTRAQKEKFARGYEQWLREGKAPTVELSSVFARFKHWLKNIYSSARALKVSLNDEVRGVFNRLIDAENETRTAAALNGMVALTPNQMDALGIVSEKQETMRVLTQTAMQKAELKLFDARRKAEIAERPALRIEAEKEILAEDVNDVYGMIDTIVEEGLQFDRDEYNELQGNPEAYKFLPSKRISKKNGKSLSETAQTFGFESREAFIAVVSSTLSKDIAIKGRLDRKLQELYNSISSEDFIFSTKEYLDYLTLLGEELRSNKDKTEQATRTGKSKKIISREQIRKFAKETLDSTNVTDAGRPELYSAAMKRASIAQSKFIKKADWAAALRENEKVRLNHEMARLAVKNRDLTKKIVQRSRKSANSNTIIKTHKEQIRSIIQRYRIGLTIRPDAPTKLVPLTELFKSEQHREGFIASEFLVTPRHRDFARRYRTLTLEQFKEVDRAIRYLTRIGRQEYKQLLSDGKTKINDLVESFLPEIFSAPFRKNKDNQAIFVGLSNVSRKAFAELQGLDYLIKALGGSSLTTGVLSNLEINTTERLKDVRDTQGRLESTKRKEVQPYTKHIIAAQRALNKEHKNKLQIKDNPVPVPVILQDRGRQVGYFTTEQVFAMAGHRGAQSNIDALLSGYPGLTLDQVDALLNEFLTVKDMDAIQAIRDVNETLKAPTQEVFSRMNGHSMAVIEPQPFIFKGKEYRGGFWHIDIDTNLAVNTGFLEKVEIKTAIEKHDSKYATPYSDAGHTNERVKHKLPIRLSLFGVYKHINKATRYLTQAETVKDVDRIITNETFKSAAIDVMGEEKYGQLRPALKSFANPGIEGYDVPGNRMIMSMRAIATAKNLSWFAGKFLTGPKQLGSVIGGINDLGRGKGIGGGFSAYMKGATYVATKPIESHNIMLEKSVHMAQRQRKIERAFLRPRFEKMKPAQKALVWGDSEVTWDDIKDLGFAHIFLFDRAASDPIWWGGYLDKINDLGTNEKEAVRHADNAIQGSQPNVDPLTLPAWLRKGGFYNLFNIHQTYTVGVYGQRQRAFNGEWRAGRMTTPQFAWFNFSEGIVPALLIQIMVAVLRGRDVRDKETWWGIAEGTVTQWLTMGVPLVSSLIGALTQEWRNIFEIPGTSTVDDTLDAINDAWIPLDEMTAEDRKRLFFGFLALGAEYAKVPIGGLVEQVIEEPSFRGKIFGTAYEVKRKQKKRIHKRQ